MKMSKLCIRGCKIIKLTSFDAAFKPFMLMGNKLVINNIVTFS